jgi:transposase
MAKSEIIRRRRHSAAFRDQVLSECAAPGASITQIAKSHGLSPNVVYRWRQRAAETATPAVVSGFVPLPWHGSSSDIRIGVRRRNSVVEIQWPADQADACARWLHAWLR